MKAKLTFEEALNSARKEASLSKNWTDVVSGNFDFLNA